MPTPRELRDFAEAMVALALASAAVRLLPFRWVVRTMGRGDPAGARREGDTDAVRTAVERAGRRLPWRTVCIQQGLAAHWLLRRRRFASRLHYGILQEPALLKAHVWVTLGEKVVIGEEHGQSHLPVACFPAD